MSNYRSGRSYEEESSHSSDEKMDTGSESFRSQDTPNSTLSSEFDERSEPNVLRLQDPAVLRLSAPESNHNTSKELSNSFINKMSALHLDSLLQNRDRLSIPINSNLDRPKNLGISPPKFSTSLVLTTRHPLMSSPEYPDVIPKQDKEQDLSLSSFEEDRPSETNGFSMYSLNTNNSKNNLYYSENFVTADSQILCASKVDNTPPDVAKVKLQRRKIIPRFVESPKMLDSSLSIRDTTPHRVLGRVVDGQGDEATILKYIEERNKKLSNHSTPKGKHYSEASDRVAEWCDASEIRPAPAFELPIELSSSVTANNELESPEALSSSTQGSRSLYQALVDPATGRAALRPTVQPPPPPPLAPHALRRTIALPPEEEDSCSLDSLSVSMDSEDEPPELDPNLVEQPNRAASEDIKRSKSSNTCSEDSDPIPEYSAAEEFHNERSYVSVDTGDSHATCDMKVIEPYKRVLSHGGYDNEGSAIIVFSACYLPDTHRTDYKYVMDNLFLYVMWTLDRLIGREYVLVYLHGSAGSHRMPSFRWLHECYRLIDRRLRKSLKHLYLVHPTFWLKSFVLLTKPFVSSKFFRKLSYVPNLDRLQQLVPVEPNAIPDLVRAYDQGR